MGITEKEYIARYQIYAQVLIGCDFQYEPHPREEIYAFQPRDIRIARILADDYRGNIRGKYNLPKIKLESLLEKTIDEQMQRKKNKEEKE